jgi:hypothetical protein
VGQASVPAVLIISDTHASVTEADNPTRFGSCASDSDAKTDVAGDSQVNFASQAKQVSVNPPSHPDCREGGRRPGGI